MPPMSLIVEPLTSQDTFAVKQLIIAGLTERWGTYQPGLNPDVEELSSETIGSYTLVAKLAGAVVGTGTLRRINQRRAEIIRMSTAATCRRLGVASTILATLLEYARSAGVREIVLETTSSWDSAISFYIKHGFVKTKVQNGDTYFVHQCGEA